MKAVEVNARQLSNDGRLNDRIYITPPIDEDYWLYRVPLRGEQAIVAFPKFGTIGIGFAQEKDWNSNLPFSCSTERIYRHIRHNKGDKAITKSACLEAIESVREAARLHRGLSDTEWVAEQERMAP